MVRSRFADGSRSIPRLLGGYGLLTLVPVLALGIGLALAIRSSATHRGLSQARLEATLIAQTAVEPDLDGRPLTRDLSAAEQKDMGRLVRRAVADHHVLRLRLRDLAGRVVFSDNPAARSSGDGDGDALEAARGATVAHLTHLNSDDDDAGPAGAASAEVYLPLRAGQPARPVGVLEIYLPYAPIAAEVNDEMRVLYLALTLGLAALYVVLCFITFSVTRRLRRQVATNAFLARHDSLTGLPNRSLFIERAQQAVQAARRRGQPSAIAIIDLDRFQEINDTLGHLTGDELLVTLADRLAGHVEDRDTIARLGGDEFGLVLGRTEDPGVVLSKIRELIGAELRVHGVSLTVEASIGYVRIVDDGTDTAETLMQRAELAMYEAKAQHLGPVEYRPELDRYDAGDLELMSQLRAAIPAGELVLHYQPQVDPASGEVAAVEALLRWQHPEHGLLRPDRFLPIAERTDLIHEISDWVLDAAMRDAAAFEAEGLPLTMAVNASARSIVRPDFALRVLSAVERHAVAPERLVVEVTETALLTDPRAAAEVLSGLSAAGVQLSIDDFGAGQTSLGYLSALPVDELKIDRSFVTDLADHPTHAAIVRSIVELGHNLGMRVVGEGVETEEVLGRLAGLGCDLAQGFLMARPMSAEALVRFLAGSQSAPAVVAPADAARGVVSLAP